MKHSRLKRVLALVLVAALICGMNLSSAYAVEAASTPVTFQEPGPQPGLCGAGKHPGRHGPAGQRRAL